MRFSSRWLLCITALLAASSAAACGAYRSGGNPPEMDSGVIEYSTRGPGLKEINNFDSGLMMSDGRNGYMWSPGGQRELVSPAVLQAHELRLRVKELAAQLLETHSNELLVGMVALPVSFVNLNDFNESSPFGRYMAEAMYYEFNQRGMPVLEYRLNGKITMRPLQGEFALTRNLPPLPDKKKWSAVLVGTYLKEGGALIVNVRLVRPTDGMVLRTAQMIFGDSGLVASMSVRPVPPAPPPPPPLSSGTLRINPPNQPKATNASRRRGR